MAKAPGSLDEVLDALEKDHEFLLKGDVFTQDVIDVWLDYKRLQGSRRHPPAAASVGVRALLRHLRPDVFVSGAGVAARRRFRCHPPGGASAVRRTRVSGPVLPCHLSLGSLPLPDAHRGRGPRVPALVRASRTRPPPTSTCRRWPRSCRRARRWARSPRRCSTPSAARPIPTPRSSRSRATRRPACRAASFLRYLRRRSARARRADRGDRAPRRSSAEILIRNPEYFHWLVAQVDRAGARDRGPRRGGRPAARPGRERGRPRRRAAPLQAARDPAHRRARHPRPRDARVGHRADLGPRRRGDRARAAHRGAHACSAGAGLDRLPGTLRRHRHGQAGRARAQLQLRHRSRLRLRARRRGRRRAPSRLPQARPRAGQRA